MLGRGQALEHVLAREEVVPVVPGDNLQLLGPRPARVGLRPPLQLEGGDRRDGLRHPLQDVAALRLAVGRGLDVGGARQS